MVRKSRLCFRFIRASWCPVGRRVPGFDRVVIWCFPSPRDFAEGSAKHPRTSKLYHRSQDFPGSPSKLSSGDYGEDRNVDVGQRKFRGSLPRVTMAFGWCNQKKSFPKYRSNRSQSFNCLRTFSFNFPTMVQRSCGWRMKPTVARRRATTRTLEGQGISQELLLFEGSCQFHACKGKGQFPLLSSRF